MKFIKFLIDSKKTISKMISNAYSISFLYFEKYSSDQLKYFYQDISSLF